MTTIDRPARRVPREEERFGLLKCPSCPRYVSVLWRIQGDDRACCSECMRRRRAERRAALQPAPDGPEAA